MLESPSDRVAHKAFTRAVGMATVQPSSRIAIRAFACVSGVGFSSPLTLMSVCAQLASPPELLALASVNLLVSRALGGVVAVSCYNAVVKTRFAALLAPRLRQAVAGTNLTPEQIQGLIAAAHVPGAPGLRKVPGVPAEVLSSVEAALRQVWADSCEYMLLPLLRGRRRQWLTHTPGKDRWIWVIAAPVALVAIAGVCCLEPISPMMTREIDAPADVKKPDASDVEGSELGGGGGEADDEVDKPELTPEVELIETTQSLNKI